MSKNKNYRTFGPISIDLTDEDVMAAMKSIQSYIDITPADFKEVYKIAFGHAVERFGQSIVAEDIMTKPVVFVNPDTDLIETARRMDKAGISGVPVIDSQRVVVGVISEKDFLLEMENDTFSLMGVVAKCLSGEGCLAVPIRKKNAGDIMTAPAITVGLNSNISQLSRILKDNHINRIPVVNDEGKILGIVSRGDLVHFFYAKIV